MKILLDTHTFIWFVEDSPQLSSTAKSSIEYSSDVYISIASIWEIAIKRNLNKLDFDVTINQIFDELTKLNIELLQITKLSLSQLEKLPLYHRDPFDRLIIAQAISENMSIISKDKAFDLYNISTVW